MEVPQEFKKKFEKLMNASEYKEFISSLLMNRTAGLRINHLKIDLPHWFCISPFQTEPVPWAMDGFYLEEIPVFA